VLPNFFLAGVPKAGTTSLYHYLAQHPQIYMSPLKEPCFFASEFRPKNCDATLRRSVERSQRELKQYFAKPVLTERFGAMVCEWPDYLRLFEGVRDETVVGEATPGYLWSKTAARNIHDQIPGARILIMLRDPAERAFSQHLHVRAASKSRRTFREHIEANLRNQSKQFGLDYPLLEFGLYHEQLLRYFQLFPREQICVQLYDDYQADPASTFSAIFRFLKVDAAFVPQASKRHLEGSAPRRPALVHALQKTGVWQAAKRLTPRALLPIARRAAFLPREQVKMSAEDRRFLVDYYAEDVRKVAGLIGRDLSAWLAPDRG
jgi:hypothetical protein